MLNNNNFKIDAKNTDMVNSFTLLWPVIANTLLDALEEHVANT